MKKIHNHLIVIGIIIAVIATILGINCYKADQRALFESIHYQQAKDRFYSDRDAYGNNDEIDGYYDAVESLGSLETRYKQGSSLSIQQIAGAKRLIDTTRTRYIDEAERMAEQKRMQEEAERAEEEARREEAERKAAKVGVVTGVTCDRASVEEAVAHLREWSHDFGTYTVDFASIPR